MSVVCGCLELKAASPFSYLLLLYSKPHHLPQSSSSVIFFSLISLWLWFHIAKMSSSEDSGEDSNGDSFQQVKQRLKERSKVYGYLENWFGFESWVVYIFGVLIWVLFGFRRKWLKPRICYRNKRFILRRSCPNRLLRSPNKPKNMKVSSARWVYDSNLCECRISLRGLI